MCIVYIWVCVYVWVYYEGVCCVGVGVNVYICIGICVCRYVGVDIYVGASEASEHIYIWKGVRGARCM
jgi:hypothetical protein